MDKNKRKSNDNTPEKKKKRKKANRKTTEIILEKHENYNKLLTDQLEEMAILEKNTGSIQKYKVYLKAISALKNHHKKIESGAEAKKLNGIGDKISKKIDEILKTGKLKKIEDSKNDPKVVAINKLSTITGFGPVNAKKFVDLGINSVEELRVDPYWSQLNHHQQIGVKYYDDFEEKIPRAEMDQIRKIVEPVIHKVNSKLTSNCCGSYRRGKDFSSDIDFLLCHPDFTDRKEKTNYVSKIVEKLKEMGYLYETISLGPMKYNGVFKLKDEKGVVHKYRRIDIMLIPYHSYPFALLHFTGSAFFNAQMRTLAQERGFTLSEYEICPLGETDIKGPPIQGIETEAEIFEYINMEYKEPSQRDL